VIPEPDIATYSQRIIRFLDGRVVSDEKNSLGTKALDR